jgi:hypothetical protein
MLTHFLGLYYKKSCGGTSAAALPVVGGIMALVLGIQFESYPHPR